MVKEPDPTTFATDEPEIVPCRAEEITATLAGPPDAQPAMALAISIKNFPRPVFQDTPQKDKKENKGGRYAHRNTENTFRSIEEVPDHLVHGKPAVCQRSGHITAEKP